MDNVVTNMKLASLCVIVLLVDKNKKTPELCIFAKELFVDRELGSNKVKGSTPQTSFQVLDVFDVLRRQQ